MQGLRRRSNSRSSTSSSRSSRVHSPLAAAPSSRSWLGVEDDDNETEIVGIAQRPGLSGLPHGPLGYADEVDGFQGYTFSGLATRAPEGSSWVSRVRASGNGVRAAEVRRVIVQADGKGRPAI